MTIDIWILTVVTLLEGEDPNQEFRDQHYSIPWEGIFIYSDFQVHLKLLIKLN